MSAVAISVCDDGIVVASDGVCYDYDSGNVGGYVSKVILMPEYSCFIATTGMGAFGAALRWEVNQGINSFDDFVDGFERIAKAVHTRLCFSLFGATTGPETEVSCVIGGWSDRRQAYEAYRLVSYGKQSINGHDGASGRLEPFKAEKLPGAIWCSFTPDHMAEFGLAPPPSDMETAEILARMISACRADSGYSDDRYANVGGFLQMTVVQRDHIQSWVSHRWREDEIGRPIDPSKGLRIAPWQLQAA